MDYIVTKLKSLFSVSTPKEPTSEEPTTEEPTSEVSNNYYLMFYISSGAIILLLVTFKVILKALHRGIHTFLHFFVPNIQVNHFSPATNNICIPLVKNDLTNFSPPTSSKERSARECTSSLSLNTTCIWDNNFQMPELNHPKTSPLQTSISSTKTEHIHTQQTQRAIDQTTKPYLLVGKHNCIHGKKERTLKDYWPMKKAYNEPFESQPSNVMLLNKSESQEKCRVKKKIRSSWTLCCEETKRDKPTLHTDCTGIQDHTLGSLANNCRPLATLATAKHLVTQKSMHEHRCVNNVNTCKRGMYSTQEEDMSSSYTDDASFPWPDFRDKILVCRTSPARTEDTESTSTSAYNKSMQTYFLQKTTETSNIMTEDSDQEFSTHDDQLWKMLRNMKKIYEENYLDYQRYEEAKFRLLKYFNNLKPFHCKRQDESRDMKDFVRHEQVHMVESLFSLEETSQSTGDKKLHSHTVKGFRYDCSPLDEIACEKDNELLQEINQQDYNTRYSDSDQNELSSGSVSLLENVAFKGNDTSPLGNTPVTSDGRQNGDNESKTEMETDSIEIVADIISLNEDCRSKGNDILFELRKESVPASFVTLSSFLKAKEIQQEKEIKNIPEINTTKDVFAQNDYEKPLSDHKIFLTDHVKPFDKQVSPCDHVKPLNKQVKPLDDQVKPLVDNMKPLNKQVKPLDDQVKPLVDNMKPLNKQVKPLDDKVKPLAAHVKPLDENVKPNIKKLSTKTKKNVYPKSVGSVKRQQNPKEMSKVSSLVRPMALLELLLGSEKQAPNKISQENDQNLIVKKSAKSLLTRQPSDKTQKLKEAKLNSKSSFRSKFSVKNWKPGVLRNMKRELDNKCKLRITKRNELTPTMVSCMDEICGPSDSISSMENGAEPKTNKLMSVSVDFITFQSSDSSVFKDTTDLNKLKTTSKPHLINSSLGTNSAFKSPVKELTVLISTQELDDIPQSPQQRNSKSSHKMTKNAKSLLGMNTMITSPPPCKVVACVISPPHKLKTQSQLSHEITMNAKSSHRINTINTIPTSPHRIINTISTSPHRINTMSTSPLRINTFSKSPHEFHTVSESHHDMNIDSRPPQGRKASPISPMKALKGINDTLKQSSPRSDTTSYGMVTVYVSQHSLHSVPQSSHIDTNYKSPNEVAAIHKSPHRLDIVYQSPHRIITTRQSPPGMTTIPQTQCGIDNIPLSPHRITSIFQSPHGMTAISQSPHEMTTIPEFPHGIATIPHSPCGIDTIPQSPCGIDTIPQSLHRLTFISQSPHRIANISQSPHGMKAIPQSPNKITAIPQSPHERTTISQSPHRKDTIPKSPHVVSVEFTNRIVSTPQSIQGVTNNPQYMHNAKEIRQSLHGINISQSPCILDNNLESAQRMEHSNHRTTNISGALQEVEKALKSNCKLRPSSSVEKSPGSSSKPKTIFGSVNNIEVTMLVCSSKSENNLEKLSKCNGKKSDLKPSTVKSRQKSTIPKAKKHNQAAKPRETNTLVKTNHKEQSLAVLSPCEQNEEKYKTCRQKKKIFTSGKPKSKLTLLNECKEDEKIEGIKKKIVSKKISFIAATDSREITTDKTLSKKAGKRKSILPESLLQLQTTKFDVIVEEKKSTKTSMDFSKKLQMSSSEISKKLPKSSSVISKKFYMPRTQKLAKSSIISTSKQDTSLQAVKMVGLLPLSVQPFKQQKTIRKIRSCFHLEPDIENSINHGKENCLENNIKNMRKTPFQRKLQFLLKNNKYVFKKNLQAKNVAALIKRSSDVINNTKNILNTKKLEGAHKKMADKKVNIAQMGKRGKKNSKLCKGHQKKSERDSSICPESIQPVSVTSKIPNILIPTISLLYKKNSLKYKSKSLYTNLASAALLNEETGTMNDSHEYDQLTKFYSDHQVIKVIRSKSMNYLKYNKASDICTLHPPSIIQLKGMSCFDLLPTIYNSEVSDFKGQLDNDNQIKGDRKKCVDQSLALESLDVNRVPSAKSVFTQSSSLCSESPKHVNIEKETNESNKVKDSTFRQTVGNKDVSSDNTNLPGLAPTVQQSDCMNDVNEQSHSLKNSLQQETSLKNQEEEKVAVGRQESKLTLVCPKYTPVQNTTLVSFPAHPNSVGKLSCPDTGTNLVNNVIPSVSENSIWHDNKTRSFFPFNPKNVKQDEISFMSADLIKGPSVKNSDSSETSLISSHHEVSKPTVGFKSVSSEPDLEVSKAAPVSSKQRQLSSADFVINPLTDPPLQSLHECMNNKKSHPKSLNTLALPDFNSNVEMPIKDSKLINKTAKQYHPSFSFNELVEEKKSSYKWHSLSETGESIFTSSCIPEAKIKTDLWDIEVKKQDLDSAAKPQFLWETSKCQFGKQMFGLEEKLDRNSAEKDTSIGLPLKSVVKIQTLEKENKEMSEEKNDVVRETYIEAGLYASLEEKDSTTFSIATELEAVSYHFGDDVTLKSCSNLEVSNVEVSRRSLSLMEWNSLEKLVTQHKRRKTMVDASPLVQLKKRRLSVLSRKKKKLKYHVRSINKKMIRKYEMKSYTTCSKLPKSLDTSQTQILENENCKSMNTLELKEGNQHAISKSEENYQVNENTKRSEDLESLLNLELTGYDEGLDSNLYPDTKLLFSKHNRSVKKTDRNRRRSNLNMGRVALNFPMSRENSILDRENKNTESNQTLHSIHPPKPAGKKSKKLSEFLLSKRQCEVYPIYVGQVPRSKCSTLTNSTAQSSEEEERLLAVLEQPIKIHSSRSRGKTFEPADCPRPIKSTGASSVSVELKPTKRCQDCLKEYSVKDSCCNENLCSEDIITPYTDLEEVDLPSEHYIHCVVPQDSQLDRNMSKEYLSLPTHKSTDCRKKKEEDNNESTLQISSNLSKSSLPQGLESQGNSFSNQSKNQEVHISEMFLTQSTIDRIHDDNDHLTLDNKSSSSSSIVLSWIGSDVSEVDTVLDPNTHGIKCSKTVHGQDVNLLAGRSGNFSYDYFHSNLQHTPISPFKLDPIETLNNSMETYCNHGCGYGSEQSHQFKQSTSFRIVSDNQSLVSHSNYLPSNKTSKQKELIDPAAVFHSNQGQSASDFPFTNESGQDFTSCSETMSGSNSFGEAVKNTNTLHYKSNLLKKTKQENTGQLQINVTTKSDSKKRSKLKLKVGPLANKQHTITCIKPHTLTLTEPCPSPSLTSKSMTPENKLQCSRHKKTLPSTEHLPSSSSYNSFMSRQNKLKSSKSQYSNNKTTYHKPDRDNATSDWYKPQYVPLSPSLTDNHSWPLNLKAGSSKSNNSNVQEALSEPLNCTRNKWPHSETNSDVDTCDVLPAETHAHNRPTDHQEESQITPPAPQKVKNIIQMFEQRKTI